MPHQRRQHRDRSRSPRRTAPEAQSGEKCKFCGIVAELEFGREESFCSDRCYRASVKGIEAIDWDGQEACEWLEKEEGLGRWRRKLQFLDSGLSLLTKLTEGTLRKVGVPRPKAKSVMADIEFLRQGVWAQPEPPRVELPLSTVTELGRKLKYNWVPALEDEAHRSYAGLCRNAIDSNLAWKWYHMLRTQLPWQDLCDTRYQNEGRMIPRRTIFTVLPGCSCVYKYSGVKVEPTLEPDFVAEIRRICATAAGLQDNQPNACNINLYRDGNDSVGWHTDDEEVFESDYNDACILSLSLGATRTFCVKRKPPPGSPPGAGKKGAAEASFQVAHADLCTMEGRFQRWYLHAVLKEPKVKEPRINLTWRWITKHNQADGCKLHGPGN